MDIDALATHIKHLDLSVKPATSDGERDYFRHYRINIEENYPNVTHHFGHFPSGRFDIVAHYFELKGATQTCFILHGYYDHAGLYGHIIEYCIKKNFSVVIYDLPGHGLSTGKQACISDFSDYQSVLKDVISVFSKVAPKPWHVISQSTGAAVLMDYLLTEKESCFSKTVFLAPLLRPVQWRMSLVMYEMTKLCLKSVPRRFSSNSNDQSFIDFLKGRDPLQAQHLSMRWVGSLKRWIKRYKSLAPSDYAPLIIQGEKDGTVDWQRNIPQIKEKFPGAKVLYLKDGRHHLANESEEIREKVFSAMDIYFDAKSVS
jgi:alpha-beta hydrolase superfamily lysophospholipase